MDGRQHSVFSSNSVLKNPVQVPTLGGRDRRESEAVSIERKKMFGSLVFIYHIWLGNVSESAMNRLDSTFNF